MSLCPRPDKEWNLLTRDDVAGTRFSSTQFRPGYRPNEVDDFLERVIDTLDVLDEGGNVADPVTSEEAPRVSFSRTKGFSSGYEIAEVDAFLAQVVETLSMAPSVVAGCPDSERPKRSRISTRDVFGILRDLVVGDTPEQRPAKAPRVRRIAGRYLRVEAGGIHWRTWTGNSGTLVAADVAAVVLLDVTTANHRGPDMLQSYALLLDRSGSPLLRVGLGCWGRRWRAKSEFKSWLKEVWAPLGVPVTRWSHESGRVKDARRRWPTALSFAHAYPYWTGLIMFGVYCAGASIVDALLQGT